MFFDSSTWFNINQLTGIEFLSFRNCYTLEMKDFLFIHKYTGWK